MKTTGQLFSTSRKDERLSAQLGQVYKVGFFIMVGGILFDLFTRYNYLANQTPDGSQLVESPLEWATLVIACVVVAAMAAKRGVVSDSLRFTEARTFPETGLLPVGVGAALFVSLAAVGGRLYNEVVLFGWSEVTWAGDIAMLIFMVMMFTPLFLLALYVAWRSYRRQEDRLMSEEDD